MHSKAFELAGQNLKRNNSGPNMGLLVSKNPSHDGPIAFHFGPISYNSLLIFLFQSVFSSPDKNRKILFESKLIN